MQTGSKRPGVAQRGMAERLRMRRNQRLAPAVALLAALTVAAVGPGISNCQAGLMATADISATQLDATTFRYALTLHDTGTTNIGTFWYAWVPGKGFLDSAAFNAHAPAGWTANLTDNSRAVQWVTSSNAVAASGSLSGFGFDSHDTPAQVFGLSNAFPTTPVGTSFVYIGAPFGDPGLQFVATAVPEPAGLALAAIGAVATAALFLRRNRAVRATVVGANVIGPERAEEP